MNRRALPSQVQHGIDTNQCSPDTPVLRSIVLAVLSFALRIFFSRIEVEGGTRLPSDRAMLFVLNHPNGLVDPLVLLCFAPRRVSFLAKEPLFRLPVIGAIVRALDALPVYRTMDNADPRKNAETFAQARTILARGGAIGMFPEGTTHSDSRLRPLKTGAARIALGAAAGEDAKPMAIVPAGLYYTNKGTFRSKALLVFGAPIDVPALPSAADPPREAVNALSKRIREGLLDVTVNAADDEALAWVARAQRIFSAPQDGTGALASEFALRRRFVEGFEAYGRIMPARLLALEQRIAAYEQETARFGVVPDRIPLEAEDTERVARQEGILSLLAGPAALGALVHWPLYRFIGWVSNRFVAPRDSTVVSTVKLCASMVAYPLLWLAVSLATGGHLGATAALGVLLLCPVCAWSAVLFEERWIRLCEVAAPLALRRRDAAEFERLRQERLSIRAEIERMYETLEGTRPGLNR